MTDNWQGTGKAFPVPPVCTANWTASDWQRYEDRHGINPEPDTINSTFGVWRKTGLTDEKGQALYELEGINETLNQRNYQEAPRSG